MTAMLIMDSKIHRIIKVAGKSAVDIFIIYPLPSFFGLSLVLRILFGDRK